MSRDTMLDTVKVK